MYSLSALLFMIEIKPVGHVHDIDKKGYIVNPCSKAKLQSPWKEAVQELVDAYVAHHESDLHSIYLRGSVPKGTAVPVLSDIDSFAFFNGPVDHLDRSWMRGFCRQLRQTYPEVDGAEIIFHDVAQVAESESRQFLLSTQSLCIWGEDLIPSLPKFKPGPIAMGHCRHLARDIEHVKTWYAREDIEEARIPSLSRWIFKRLVRAGYEFVMERDNSFTRDLYFAWHIFSKYYPGKSEEMKQAVHLILNPSTDKSATLDILNNLGAWLVDEIEQSHLTQ